MNAYLRTAAFRAALVLLLVSTPARAQWWNDAVQPGTRVGKPVLGPPPDAEVVYSKTVFEQAGSAAIATIFNEDFAKLERMHDEFLAAGIRSTHGHFMVEAIQGAWDAQFRSGDYKSQFDLWKAKVPQSRMRTLLEAIKWQRHAWNARGGGYGSSVPGESMALFRERLALAARTLQESEPAGRESPIWYWVALIVAGSSGRPAAEFDALFEEGVTRFPYYHSLYYTRMNYLLPQWGGSYEEVDAFIAKAVERTKEKDGDAFYAWLYVDVARKLEGDLFEGTRASWPKMRKAFKDMVARYPDAWNKNLFATFACRARDRETTGQLITELGAAARLGAWSPGFSTESCRRFAFSPA